MIVCRSLAELEKMRAAAFLGVADALTIEAGRMDLAGRVLGANALAAGKVR